MSSATSTDRAAVYGNTYPASDSRAWEVLTGRPCVCGQQATEVAAAHLDLSVAEPDPRGRHRLADWLGVCSGCAETINSAVQTLNTRHTQTQHHTTN